MTKKSMMAFVQPQHFILKKLQIFSRDFLSLAVFLQKAATVTAQCGPEGYFLCFWCEQLIIHNQN